MTSALAGVALVPVFIVAGIPASDSPRDVPPDATFPVEYSLSRPLLAANPRALVAGEDWQWARRTEDLRGRGFYLNKNNANRSGRRADASTIPVVNGPPDAHRAEIARDPVFGSAVRLWQTDRSDGDEHTVYYERNFEPTTKAWYRILIKYMPGFTNDGQPPAAQSWKMVFTTYYRHVEWTNNRGATNFTHTWGEPTILPGSPRPPGSAWYVITTEWTDAQWWELIFYEERLSDSTLRVRRWARQLTFNDAIVPNAKWSSRFGFVETARRPLPPGAQRLQLGINRNRKMFSGRAQWWMWGPWEVLDGNVIPDPYGLASDMLR